MTKNTIFILSSLPVLFFLFPLHSSGQSLPGGDPSTDAVTDATTDQPSGGGVIGLIQTRDKVLIIRTGAGGRSYSVTSRDGEMLADEISSDELKARFPELTDLVEQGIAGDASLRRDTGLNNRVTIRVKTDE